MSGGPELSGGDIADIDKSSRAIAGGILPPAGNGEFSPTAIATPRVADDDVITAVGQQMNLRRFKIGIGKDPHEAFAVADKPLGLCQFIVFGKNLGGGLRDALLEEEVGGFEGGER